jgi:hypothetical protein
LPLFSRSVFAEVYVPDFMCRILCAEVYVPKYCPKLNPEAIPEVHSHSIVAGGFELMS